MPKVQPEEVDEVEPQRQDNPGDEAVTEGVDDGIEPQSHQDNAEEKNHARMHRYGIGVTFKRDPEGYFMVQSLGEVGGGDSGLLVGDRIMSTGEVSFQGMSIQELSDVVLGEQNTTIVFKVQAHDGSERLVSAKRSVLKPLPQ